VRGNVPESQCHCLVSSKSVTHQVPSGTLPASIAYRDALLLRMPFFSVRFHGFMAGSSTIWVPLDPLPKKPKLANRLKQPDSRHHRSHPPARTLAAAVLSPRNPRRPRANTSVEVPITDY